MAARCFTTLSMTVLSLMLVPQVVTPCSLFQFSLPLLVAHRSAMLLREDQLMQQTIRVVSSGGKYGNATTARIRQNRSWHRQSHGRTGPTGTVIQSRQPGTFAHGTRQNSCIADHRVCLWNK